jgi:hypothetical protein
MSPCQAGAALPWLLPCCPDCAAGRHDEQAGSTGPGEGGMAGGGALLVLGAIAVAVLYGETILKKLG